MKNVCFCILLFLFGCTDQSQPNHSKKLDSKFYYTKAINEKETINVRIQYIDSALQIAKRKPIDTFFLKLVNNKSYLLYLANESDSTFYYDKLLYKYSQKANDTYYKAISSKNIGAGFESRQKSDSAFYYFNKSRNHFAQLSDSLQVGRCLLRLAYIQKNHKDLYGAKETLVQALKYINISNNKYIARINDLLGTVNRNLLNYKDAINYHQKAISLSDEIMDKIGYKNNLALAYRDMDNYTKSIEALKLILQDSVLDKNSSRYARIVHNLTESKWLNGDSAVETDFFHALQLRKKNKDLRGLVSSYTTLGEFYSKSFPIKAKKYLDSLIIIAKQIKIPEGEVDALGLYMALEPKNIAHKDRYIFLKDSLYQQELKVKTQFAKMKYDDEQEKARLLVLEAETAQNETQLAKQETQRILLLSLFTLFLMGAGSYYFVLRAQHKKKTLREIYNTEKKISKKIHDGLANDVYGVMTAMQHQKIDPSEAILDQLEDIYKRTRDISHDTRELSTGKGFVTELKDMLQGFNGNGTKVLTKGIENVAWEKLNEHKCVALHRTLKELLVNMKKHSGAGLVILNFKEGKRKLLVEYTDNGIGVKEGQKHGVGLQNTENRIQSVGGKFIFGGVEGKGVKVTISIPI